jgi:hypothetical protein
LDRDNRILKKGVAYQNVKLEKGEEEVGQLRAGNRQAMEYIGRLEQANRSLCYRLMVLEGGGGGGGGGGGMEGGMDGMDGGGGGGGFFGGAGGGGGGRDVF